jgi:hypothetical protein
MRSLEALDAAADPNQILDAIDALLLCLQLVVVILQIKSNQIE